MKFVLDEMGENSNGNDNKIMIMSEGLMESIL